MAARPRGALGAMALGWVCLIALAVLAGRSPAAHGALFALMALVAIGHGLALGHFAGLAAALACAALGVAAVPALGTIGAIALGAGLAAAGLAAGALGLRHRRVHERVASAEAELASAKTSLREATDDAAALRSRLPEHGGRGHDVRRQAPGGHAEPEGSQ